MKTINRISLFLLAFVIMTGLLNVGPASAADKCKLYHTVKGGEYLIQIANLYNVNWRTLVELNDITDPSKIYPNQKLCISTDEKVEVTVKPVSSSSNTSDKVYALEVVEDKNVTLVGKGLTANTRYSVYMNRYGTSITYFAGSVLTNSNGAFQRTLPLPKKLVDVAKINFQLQNGAAVAASNWFINADAEDGETGGVSSPEFTFSILDVDYGDSIEIKTSNMPANVTFVVRIGKSGTKGEGGIVVGSLRDNDGTVRETFDIPEELADRSSLDIRVENKALGTYYYKNFKNKK